jgi:hypothetical protein
MKALTVLLLAPFFCVTQVAAQILRAKPLAEKTVVPVANAQNLRVVQEQKKPAPPPPAPTNIQNVAVDIQNGDDGKDNDTEVWINFSDNNQRVAAAYSDVQPTPTGLPPGRPNDEYYAGSSITLPMNTQMSIPTGQTMKVGALILPVLRYATVADFSNGGKVKIMINPNGHDTWKISTIDVKISFQNDPHSPHDIRWSNIVLSQDGTTRELLFDKNFNPL